MDFSISERQRHWRDRVVAFMAKHIYPAVDTYHKQMEAFGANRWQVVPDHRGAEGEGAEGRSVEPVPAADR